MTDLALELAALRQQNEELKRRLEERQRSDERRRALRGCETVEEISERGIAFATAELGGGPALLLLDDPASSAFIVQAVANLPREREEESRSLVIARADVTATSISPEAALTHSEASPVEAVAPFVAIIGSDRLVVSGLYDGSELVGLIVVGGDELVSPRLLETSAELSAAIAAALRARSRAEELALLEIQERELVGLLREVEQRDETMQADLQQAREFQQLMMAVPPVAGARIEALYEPCGLVGGDVYVVSELPGKIRIFVADATGHGVRASLTTMFIKSGYESLKHAPDPATLLRELNESIAGTYRSSEMMFSACCVDVERETGKLTLGCAGHPPACLVRGNDYVLLEARGALMGVRSGMRYEHTTTTLGPGDGLYVFTDGIAEARGENGDFFGEQRLYTLLRDTHVAGRSVSNTVRDTLRSFAGKRGLPDDVSLVGIRLG